MAKIVVENATVERVFTHNGGVGAAVTESYTPKDGGEARKTWFTLWFVGDVAVMKGQVVSASGFVSARVRESANGRHFADLNVNSARLIDSAPPIEPAPSADDLAWSDTPADDAWGGVDSWA